jgi:hypothetical protein
MGRPIEIEGIHVHAQTAPCANHCRYCHLSHRKPANITFGRFGSVLRRFMEWKEERGLADFKIGFWLGRSQNYDIQTLKGVMDLWECQKGRLDLMMMGGLYWRPDDEMETWLRQRRDVGVKSVLASFTGHGRFHDNWAGRRGDFDFQMRALAAAADLGMELHERLFLTNSTIPLLDELIEGLEALPGRARARYAHPFFYWGRAKRLEHERVTRETLDALPEHIKGLYQSDESPTHLNWKSWRSEGQWIDLVDTEEDAPEKVTLNLKLTEENIDRVESMSCDEIMAGLKGRTAAAYAVIPSRAELAKRYGDPSNTRIYMFKCDMETKWLDLHLAKNSVVFDRELTHLRP